jgi:hypothetical protein
VGPLQLNPIRLLLAISSGLLALCALLSGGPAEILGVLPAILLALVLSFDRYPGEELIAWVAARRRSSRRPAPSALELPASPVASLSARLVFLAGSRPLRAPPAL